MPSKKLQEKRKKIGRTRLPCTVPNRFALPSTTTKNKSIPTKERVMSLFYDYRCHDIEFQFLNPHYVEFEYIVR